LAITSLLEIKAGLEKKAVHVQITLIKGVLALFFAANSARKNRRDLNNFSPEKL
jgi:hypothetical protein